MLLRSRFSGLYVFGVLFLGASLLLRAGLCVHSVALIDTTPSVLARMFLVGMLYDVVTYFYCVIPVAIFLLVVPDRVYHGRGTRIFVNAIYFVAIFALVFDVIAEWLFWEEFGTRYNFVSVDYLAYTHQFAGSIVETLPIPVLFGFLVAGATTIFIATRPVLTRTFDTVSSFRQRLGQGVVFVLVPVVSVFLVDPSLAEITRNHYNNELSKNGVYSFLAAVRYNVVTYEQDYTTTSAADAFARWRGLMEGSGARFAPSADATDPAHATAPDAAETPRNVVVVLCESLSAKFLGVFGSGRDDTPNFDALAREGLLFRNLLATGTRTDRGIEAVISSLPPTPGRCTVKKQLTPDAHALGWIFRERGYETRFVTGCDATFDNMRAFFEASGFDVVDRLKYAPGEVTFETAWGACDGDIFAKALQSCDASHARGKRFLTVVLTVSHHQPYTFPGMIEDGRAQTREAALRYADAAAGRFIAAARTKAWFDDTLFVFTGDHCANCAAKAEMDPADFHVAAMIYAPKLVKSGVVETLASQMDLMPTVLGMMNFRYESRFFGRDVLKCGGTGLPAGLSAEALAKAGPAPMANYQDLGYLTGDRLVVLGPERRARVFRVETSGGLRDCPEDRERVLDAVAFFQTASEYVDRRIIPPEPPTRRFARWLSSPRAMIKATNATTSATISVLSGSLSRLGISANVHNSASYATRGVCTAVACRSRTGPLTRNSVSRNAT